MLLLAARGAAEPRWSQSGQPQQEQQLHQNGAARRSAHTRRRRRRGCCANAPGKRRSRAGEEGQRSRTGKVHALWRTGVRDPNIRVILRQIGMTSLS